MITTFDAVDIVWKRLIDSPLKTAINGGIYKQKRPQSSKKEDVVINSLPMVNAQLQQCVLNVNIHVPNKAIFIDGQQDNFQPDSARLQTLAGIATDLLEDVWSDDAQIHYEIQQESLFEEPDLYEHGVNFRLNFYSTNI